MTLEGLDARILGGYPRPQLVRDHWRDLGGEWGFAYDDDDLGVAQNWPTEVSVFAQRIVVPYPPESPFSGIGDRGFHPVVWYRKEVPVPACSSEQAVLIHFGAIDYRCSVWVNGALVGSHEGGHTPFSFDVTAQAGAGPAGAGPAGAGPAGATVGACPAGTVLGRDDPASTMVVVVRAEDPSDDAFQPRGKQDWRLEPHAIWYHRTTGIWQPVWLEVVHRCHIAELAWTPDLVSSTLGASVRFSVRPPAGSRLAVRVHLGAEELGEVSQTVHSEHEVVRLCLALGQNSRESERMHWSPDSPVLLEAELILTSGEEVLDSVCSYAGWRSVEVVDGRLVLNGHPQYLRMALEQGYWPESHLAAPSSAALRAEVELAKSLGLNGLRIHQKVEDPRLLYWADRLGLFIWDEMPSAYGFSPLSVERLAKEWLEVLRRDRSHPCVIAWVPLNESWGVPDMRHRPDTRDLATALRYLTSAVDPTRPVVSNDGWEHTDSDIWSVHDYSPTGAGLTERYGSPEAVASALGNRWPGPRRVVLPGGAERAQAVVLSEFGGLSMSGLPGEQWDGYATVDSPEALAKKLTDLVDAVCDCEEVAGFCYTQLTDTEQERNGLVFQDRRAKLAVEDIRAIFSRPSRAVPGEAIRASRRPPAA